MKQRTLKASLEHPAKEQIADLSVTGQGDLFKLLSKAWSEEEGWMKCTKAMPVPGGCVVQVTTQQKNPDGSYAIAEALTFVPKVKTIKFDEISYSIVPITDE